MRVFYTLMLPFWKIIIYTRGLTYCSSTYKAFLGPKQQTGRNDSPRFLYAVVKLSKMLGWAPNV